MLNKDEIMVSVCCIAYNEDRYIREALDSFLSQKTNFQYEIIVYDDASTDSTAEIIREYADKYPDIIKPIYQKENQYSKGVKIGITYVYPIAKGKYIALCEGDDFWTDNNKLQLQFDKMERHPECSMCTHSSYRVDVMSKDLHNNIVYYEDGAIIGLEQYLKTMFDSKTWNMVFQTSSFFVRAKYIKDMIMDVPEFVLRCNIGDVPLTLFMLTNGKIVHIDRLMSAYRVGREGSWTSKKLSVAETIENIDNRIELYENFKKYNMEVYDVIDNYIDYYTIHKYLLEESYDKIIKNRRLKKSFKKQYKRKRYLYIVIRAHKRTNKIYAIYTKLKRRIEYATHKG